MGNPAQSQLTEDERASALALREGFGSVSQ